MVKNIRTIFLSQMLMNLLFPFIISTLAIFLFYTYFLVIQKYKNNFDLLWMDIPKQNRQLYVFFQLLALIGGTILIIFWLMSPPNKGLMSSSYIRNMTFVILLISAITWSIGMLYYPSKLSHILVILGLILTALSSIALLAGALEDRPNKSSRDSWLWLQTLAAILLSIVTVLLDGVGWLANYILKL